MSTVHRTNAPKLLLNTRDMTVTVLDANAQRLTVRVQEPITLDNTVRVRFDAGPDLDSPVLALLNVLNTHAQQEDTVINLEWVAIHTRGGAECLLHLLGNVLGMESVHPAAFRKGQGGVFYRFPHSRRKNRGPLDGPKRSTSSPAHPDRTETRVSVRVPITIHWSIHSTEGAAYNISKTGLYIAATGTIPEKGTHIEVIYPIPYGDESVTVRLASEVVWEMSDTSAIGGGGIGVLILVAEDGADGRRWREYVDREIAFGAIPR
jgi:hypothetical protein